MGAKDLKQTAEPVISEPKSFDKHAPYCCLMQKTFIFVSLCMIAAIAAYFTTMSHLAAEQILFDSKNIKPFISTDRDV